MDKAAKWGLTPPVPLEKSDRAYTRDSATGSEKRFIDNLGKYRLNQPMSRLELLLRYRIALGKRTKWGFINPIAVMEYTDRAIAAEAK